MRLALVVICALAMAACTAPQQTPVAAPVHQHKTFSPVPPAPLREGERFLELSMQQPFTPAPANGATDEYRCFLIDPKFTERTFITGSQFLPENADILHHAIFFRVKPSDVEQARKMDSDTPGDGWTCFGGTGIGSGDARFRQVNGGAAWIAAWAPGGKESLLRANTGYEMDAGSQVVMQIHYNLLATNGKSVGADKSGIRLRLMDGKANLSPLQTTLLPGPVELPCAPDESGLLCDRNVALINLRERFGDQSGFTVGGLNLLCSPGGKPNPGPTQSCNHRVKESGTAYAVAGHMHLLGRTIKVELNPGKPDGRVLLDVPIYDFDNQGAVPLPEPVKLKAGDTLRVTCTHDATLRKQLPALKTLQPRYVVWGEGTSDEMCLGIVTWTK